MESNSNFDSKIPDHLPDLPSNAEQDLGSPSLQRRILISKLFKLCLVHLYGCSESQSEWSKNAFKFITAELTNAKEVDSLSCQSDSLNMEDTLDTEEFLEKSKAIYDVLESEDNLERDLKIIFRDLITLAVQNGTYDARYRAVIKTMAKSTNTQWGDVNDVEKSLIEKLVAINSEEAERENERRKEQQKKNMKRAFLIGLTAVGGGAVLALSAGLAAPLIGAGAVAVLGSSSAAIFTGTSGAAIIASIFGAAGAGLTGFKMTKRIGKVEQFEFSSLTTEKHLHITIAVSGFCSTEDDSGFTTPWEAVDDSSELYCLKWEGKYLRLLGSSIIDFVKREAMQAAVKEILRYTALRAVLKSIAWPLTLISAANIIDNPWNVCTQRSKETGIQLAHVLLNRHQGNRPVTLIGFSLGARVIFFCLQTMLAEKGYQGIIEDVVLIGAPVGVVKSEWEALESVVSGTLYNCYSRSDWLLKFVYRAASIQVGDVAGLGPIEVSWSRIQNIDLSETVKSHSEYSDPLLISKILDQIGIRTKPVTPPSPSTDTKDPRNIIKQISNSPRRIMANAPLFKTKQLTSQPELTSEEQDTMDRLASCKDSIIIKSIPSWNMKGNGLQICDSDTESTTENPMMPLKRVMSFPQRMGFSNDSHNLKDGEISKDAELHHSGLDATPIHSEEESQNNRKDSLCVPTDDCLVAKGITHHAKHRRHSTGESFFGRLKSSCNFEKRNLCREAIEDIGSNSEKERSSDVRLGCTEEGAKYMAMLKNPKQATISLFTRTRQASPMKESNVTKEEDVELQNELTNDDNETSIASDTTTKLFSAATRSDTSLEASTTQSADVPSGLFGKMRKNVDIVLSSPMLSRRRKPSSANNRKMSLEAGGGTNLEGQT